jgi:hypothetical protein
VFVQPAFSHGWQLSPAKPGSALKTRQAGMKETIMNRVLKTAFVSVAIVATGAATLPAANAGDWGHHRYYRHHHSHGGDALAAGVVGLAAGALLGGALASQPPPPPRYYEYDRPAYVVRRAPVRYYGGIEPWTRDWYEYCSDRYRSFNARTGTFTGYDGEHHFCVAN